MPGSAESRLAVVEEQLRGVREDLQEFTREQERTRGRLHKLEGTARGLQLESEQRNRERRQHEQHVERLLKIIGLLIAVAGIVVPLVLVMHH